jgi:hypothetical protein
MSPAEKYRLACLALRGDTEALAALGNPATLGELDAIMRDGFDGLSDDEMDLDLRGVEAYFRGDS